MDTLPELVMVWTEDDDSDGLVRDIDPDILGRWMSPGAEDTDGDDGDEWIGAACPWCGLHGEHAATCRRGVE